MAMDTVKVRIAVCGNLPKLIKWLEPWKGLECCLFKDSWELRDRLMDTRADPVDMALIESNCGCGLQPLYFRGAGGDCPVLMVTDASLDLVGIELDKLFKAKRQQREQEWLKYREERAEILALRPEAELIDRDGTPGLRLGEKERYAEDPVQAWLLRLLVNGEKSLDDIETQMTSELMPEINRLCSELWRDWEDEEGPPILNRMRQWFSENGLEPDSTFAAMLTADFLLKFTDFLEREAVA